MSCARGDLSSMVDGIDNLSPGGPWGEGECEANTEHNLAFSAFWLLFFGSFVLAS